MNRKKNRKSNQDKSKKNSKIMRCSYLTRPVFEDDNCHNFEKNIKKESGNNCLNCKHSF